MDKYNKRSKTIKIIIYKKIIKNVNKKNRKKFSKYKK